MKNASLEHFLRSNSNMGLQKKYFKNIFRLFWTLYINNLICFGFNTALLSLLKINHLSLVDWYVQLRMRNDAITWPFLELQTPNFAWKFVWTVQTNFEKFLKNKNGYQKNGRQIIKLSITHSFLELQTPNFAWKWKKLKIKWLPNIT